MRDYGYVAGGFAEWDYETRREVADAGLIHGQLGFRDVQFVGDLSLCFVATLYRVLDSGPQIHNVYLPSAGHFAPRFVDVLINASSIVLRGILGILII